MLTHLSIQHFAIIDDTDSDFYDGMNVILGETGAGKSILMDALTLLTGSRSEFEKIRSGESRAFIEGTFKINSLNHLQKFKDEYEEYVEGDTFIISRSLDNKGKSIQRINGHLVPLSMIREIMKEMIDIHSSQKDLFYFDEKKQTSILDSFIKSCASFSSDEKKIYESYKESYLKMREYEVREIELNEMINSNNDEEYIRYQVEELEKANIKENEMEELESTLASLSSFVEISSKMQQFEEESEKGLNHLFESKRVLDNLRDDNFSKAKEDFIDAYYRLDENRQALLETFKSITSQVEHIEEMKDRLYLLRALKRKYGSSSNEMIEKLKSLKATLDDLENAQYYLKKLALQKEELLPILLQNGEELTKLRGKYALILESKINQELKDLLFENAEFKVVFEDIKYNAEGNKSAKFLLRTNLGLDFLSLKDTASLGESSRLSLALKKTFFDFSNIETLIFDEIDIGLSGKAALAVAKKIKEIAKFTQVLVISHLGQVASLGEHHFLVKKVVSNNTTLSSIIELEEAEAERQIAKMINGLEDDESALLLVKKWRNEE